MNTERLSASEKKALFQERAEATRLFFDFEVIIEEFGLTPTEFEVASVICTTGLTNKEIGELTGRSTNTVKNHLTSVYRKTGIEEEGRSADKRVRMILKFIEKGALEYIPRVEEEGYKIGTNSEE